MIEFIEVLVENQEEKEELIKELLLKLVENLKFEEKLSKNEDMPSVMLYDNAFVIHIDGTLCNDYIRGLLRKNETTKMLSMCSKTGSVIVIQSE